MLPPLPVVLFCQAVFNFIKFSPFYRAIARRPPLLFPQSHSTLLLLVELNLQQSNPVKPSELYSYVKFAVGAHFVIHSLH